MSSTHFSVSSISDKQVSNFRDILLNGESTFDSLDATDASDISDDIANSKVQPAYFGPHISMPLTLENIEQMIEQFKKGKVSNGRQNLI